MSNSELESTSPGQALYESHQKIYPRDVEGRFSRLGTLSGWVLLGLFYGLPFIRWEDHQAILFDLPARKFYLFGLTLWPQDFFYLAALLILAGLTLFFFTALAGRIWCGYACPQTVWTEVFLWIEKKVEGNRNKRIRLDKGNTDTHKIKLKFIKQAIWILFSLWTGFTFVGFFTPIYVLAESILLFTMGPWEAFWIFFYGFATYGNAGWMREQVCKYMCPYARFQSAMFDKDTLIIAYDTDRGEPRGSRSRKTEQKDLSIGDCIDCKACVHVCPTGIDIREGLQYECIACSACIDACDEVMDKMQYPRQLIRYTTESADQGGSVRILRPRIIVYGLILIIAMGSLLTHLSLRIPLEMDVIRDRNTLYRETQNGQIENVYIVRILNMDKQSHRFELRIEGIRNAKLLLEHPVIRVNADSVQEFVVRVQADETDLSRRSTNLDFVLQSLEANHLTTHVNARFLGPVN
jgi:cytochrome c oxidase accessory protein FixG